MVSVSCLPGLVCLSYLPTCAGRSWRLTTLVRQELGSGASRLTAPAILSASLLPQWLAALFFCGPPASLPPCLAVITRARLQLSSRCWPPSRTLSRLASPGSWAPLVQVGLQPPPPLACLWPPQLLQRPWRRLPPELALAHVLLHRCPNGHRDAAPAPPHARAALSFLLTRDWSRAWPSRAAHQSLRLSSASLAPSLRSNLARLPRLLHALHQPLWLPVLQTLRPTLTPIETPSLTLMASPRLQAALQPPSPSLPTPLVLVGVLATSAAVACARPPSAPCGAKFERSPRDCSALRHRSARWSRLLLARLVWFLAAGGVPSRARPCGHLLARVTLWLARDCSGGLCRPFRVPF